MKKNYIVLIVIGLLLVITFMMVKSTYNGMITKNEEVSTAWAQVENVYQRRADLIPNLVNTVKGYADHEKSTLQAVIEARSKATGVNINADNINAASMKQFMTAQDGLSSALSKLMVVVERYPDLKANQNFLALQSQLEGTENRITTERRRFNESAKAYNIAIKKFPQNIFARMIGFDKKDYFKSTKGADKAPEVNF